MIAFSCVHCGQRMRITQEQGEKKAACPKCGQVVLIPDSTSGIRSRRKLAIHEVPTRVEPVPANGAGLTSFLAPPQGPGEIGRLGKYRVLAVVGSGGMGVVFRAEDTVLERVVALKAMLPTLAASPTARQRFLREAKAAAALQHDHIVTVYEVDVAGGVPFLAMPFLEGESLEGRLARALGPLPPAEVLRIAREMATALSAIHQRGWVHRDVKPANVWLEAPPAVSDGSQMRATPGRFCEASLTAGGRVKILDFGLARAAQGEIQLTQEGAIVGSPAFMAPEQAGRHRVDARADLFSLGCVMYQMATGRLPFEGPDALTTLLAVTTAEPAAPRALNAELPPAVEELIVQLLAKKPDDRPASAGVVVERIRALEAGTSSP